MDFGVGTAIIVVDEATQKPSVNTSIISMNYQTCQLGPNGPIVPALGIGTWAWGDTLFWGYGKTYGREQVRAAFLATIAQGVSFFDTAEVYGMGTSETLLGQFMQETGHTAQIATKYGPLPWRLSAQAISDALTASLKRLQQERITLYQVHWPFTFLMSQRTLMQALADEVQRGRIEAIGVSNYSAAQMQVAHRYLAERGIPLAVNQVRYSLLDRQIESNGLLATARTLGITLLAYSPLAQGLLTGRYRPDGDTQPIGPRRANPRFQPARLRQLQPLLDTMAAIGQTHDRSIAQVALNWLIVQGVLPIPGAKTAAQATENIGALGWSLTAAEVAEIDRISQMVR